MDVYLIGQKSTRSRQTYIVDRWRRSVQSTNTEIERKIIYSTQINNI